ncbi:alpha-amylase family glycosyl hydrolase [Lentibacillus cibarius]|uniref:Alpha-amlyase n=1 Tax=Lentibacillus cibarius TaxID=2583219 RepID=A0A5S3QM87_9BACI|nr:alpha-amylase family glycosyl hydrolase [Lentibacillus cibarius]TMN23074.1 alpha-amlyase [Lentibacillus cibarius]
MKRIVVLLAAVIFVVIASPVSAEEKETVNDEIFYNILVDRFNNGDQSRQAQIDLDDPRAYHGGDLQGIIDKLGHFEELGYTTLTLSPIMDNAPDGYHGYWVENFRKVDPQYGTMADLKKLVEKAHNRDIKVVLEFVTNYVSNTHPMLDNPNKSDWVHKTNPEASQQWLDQTKRVNQTNPEVQTFLEETADFWIKEANIDGYLFHAADKANKDFLQQLSTHINKQDPSFFQLASILEPANYDGWLSDIETLDAVEDHTLQPSMVETLADPGAPVEAIYDTWTENGKKQGLNYLDSKQTERFTTKLLKNGRNPLTTWKLALTYLYTAPGAPMIWQGSEIPMGGESLSDNHRFVQWNSADDDLKKFAGRIAALRSEFPALQHGDYELAGSDGSMSVFKRSFEGETVFIAINNDTHSRSIIVDDISNDKQLKGLLGDNLVRANDNGKFRIGLARETAEVYVIQNDTGLNWLLIVPIAGIFIIFIAGIFYINRKNKKQEADA